MNLQRTYQKPFSYVVVDVVDVVDVVGWSLHFCVLFLLFTFKKMTIVLQITFI